MIGDPLHETCGEAALDADELPLPSEIEDDDGPACPDRPWRWRDAEDGGRDEDVYPEGVVDTEETWQAYVALCKRHGRDPYAVATMK